MRFLPFLFGVACFVLASCTPPVEPLPVEEVLARAARESQRLDSAHFSGVVDITAEMPPMVMLESEVKAEGILQDGGETVYLVLDADIQLINAEGPLHLQGTAETVLTSGGTSFLNIQAVRSDPEHPFFSTDALDQFVGKWWSFSAEETMGQQAVLTPDPQLIRAQSQVIRVTKERGFDTVRGRLCYHYETAIDPEKLRTYLAQVAREQGDAQYADTAVLDTFDAAGELWIDAETFVVHRMRWTAMNFPITESGTAALSFTMDVQNHNTAERIILPADAQPFSLDAMVESPAVEPGAPQGKLPDILAALVTLTLPYP